LTGACLLLTPLLLLGAALLFLGGEAGASSHREAPAISKQPYADTTDVYTFISPENPDNLVLAASWIPFEGPEGGPNYYEWDPTYVYEIYVDSNGDAMPNFTYTLSSRVTVAMPETFLYNTGPIETLDSANWNRRQYITVTEMNDVGVVTTLVANQLTAPVNIGSKSTPDFEALEEAAIYSAVGDSIKVFAGQTDDAFWVDLQIFDLLTLRGQAPPIGYSQGNNIPVDSLSGFNVHSLVIELPIARVKVGDEPVLGVWAATRAPSMAVSAVAVSPDAVNTHGYSQISRLGMPLVNEVVVPLALKDAFNTLRPSEDVGLYTSGSDAGNLLQKSVENPEIGRLLCALYGVPLPFSSGTDCSTPVTAGTPRSGRGDIFDIFLTGMVLANEFTINTATGPQTLPAGFNVNRPAGVTPAEMIRINTNIKGDLCAPTPSRLGVLGQDACGFPNGRRLTDDVVEIELLAVAGAAYQVLDARDTNFTFNADLIALLDDGLNKNDVAFRNSFPYMAMAQSGQEHIHQNPVLMLLLPLMQKAAFTFGNLGGGQPSDLPWAAAASTALMAALVIPAVVVWRRRQ
jgi:hypothetical protein